MLYICNVDTAAAVSAIADGIANPLIFYIKALNRLMF